MIYEFVSKRICLLKNPLNSKFYELQMKQQVMYMYACVCAHMCMHIRILVLKLSLLCCCDLEVNSTVRLHWGRKKIVIMMPNSHFQDKPNLCSIRVMQ